MADIALEAEQNNLAKYNARLLAICQAFVGMSQSATIALGGIIGATITPLPWMATLPVTFFIIGVALTSYPASKLMQRIGRRHGFMSGAALGILGNFIAAIGVYIGSFWLFCLGTLFVGSYGAFGQLYRFAAADTASAKLKPIVMSWVLVGGVMGALGPEIINLTKDIELGVPYVASYIAIAAISTIALLFLSFLQSAPKAEVQEVSQSVNSRGVKEFLKEPLFLMAAFSGAAGYALMNLVMTAAPLAMLACEHPNDKAFTGITLHVFAMFAPSYFTGNLIAKYSAAKITLAGFAILLSCAAVALAGITVAHFWIALILLGVGWNFAFLGSSAMVTQIHTNEERGTAQGLNDAIVMGTVAIASVSSGALFNLFGWNTVVSVMLPVAALGILLTYSLGNRLRTLTA